ncbi:alpha/beta hydrolase [Streptomyces sp. NPDC052682]|uniref:alpha/beta fold hydrolase n=1 Tax=Streptomyces sp. NPDC052682 TaxID=3154954 RepID=UPI00343AFC83
MTDLHHDVCGTGPVLLVLPGGAGHPMGLDRMTHVLSSRFTVVTFDPVGLAHGRLGQPVPDQRVEDWSEGAHRLLEAVLPEGGTAAVLGMSSGGIAALDLLARHPRRLRHVVAHEPPVVRLLPDGAGHRASLLREVGDPPPGGEQLTTPMEVFRARVVRPFTAYAPDLDALRAASARLTLAAGAASRGHLLHRTAAFLAERTGGAFAEFPGGHLGPLEHPEQFAERVAAALSGSAAADGGSPCPHLQES